MTKDLPTLQIACVVEQGCDSDVIKAAQEQDERHAWDAFAAAHQSSAHYASGAPCAGLASDAAKVADALLQERRKRWGSAR